MRKRLWTSCKIALALIIVVLPNLCLLLNFPNVILEPVAIRHTVDVHSSSYIEVEKPAMGISNSLGYLVILNVPEQLTAAIEDFVQLYMVNQRHWKLGMIEPYVLGSFLSFVPPSEKYFKSMPMLSKYLDRSNLIHNLKTCFHSNNVNLESFPQFLVNAARQFITLTFVTDHDSKHHKDTTKNVSECEYRNIGETQKLLNHHLHKVRFEAMNRHGASYKFVGVHSLCVKAIPQIPFSMLQVVEYIKEWKMTSRDSVLHFPHFTIVIPEWRGVHSTAGNHFYYDPSYDYRNFTGPCRMKMVSSTLYVTATAKNFRRMLLLPRPIIGVHVRSEKIAGKEFTEKDIGFIERCLIQYSQTLETVLLMYNVSKEHIMIVHDGGKYGSSSIHKLRSASNFIIARILTLSGIQNNQYTPIMRAKSVVDDRELAQFVDRELLVSADVLIMVGFGGYQKSIVEHFKSRKKRHMYRVCGDSFNVDILPSQRSN